VKNEFNALNTSSNLMVLVYTHHITPRVKYAFNMLFQQFLSCEVTYTTQVEEFIAYDGVKISYTKNPLGKELFFRSHSILFEKGIVEQEIHVRSWKGQKIFFEQTDNSAMPFDVFAAGFYLLSRYEEYLPHIKDRFHRFPAKQSLAYKNSFLKIPIIEYWLKELVLVLQTKFPNFNPPSRQFKFLNTIDVDNAYCYLEKGLIRTVGAVCRSLLQFDFKPISKRFKVLLGKEKDPYDTFDYLLKLQKKYDFESIYFFLLADYGHNDKNITHTSKKFQTLVKTISDYVKVGIHPSWASNSDSHKLSMEINRLESIVNREVHRSRQHFLRLDLPNTYRRLIDLGILHDYTMGYAAQVGFRAGTSLPFYFYDLDMEMQTSLLIHPFAVMDGTLNEYMELPIDDAQYLVKEIINYVKEVDGVFISLWHNETLGDNRNWKDWKQVYEYTIEEALK
tara:strand:- start:690 stop:2036 length:1347 start_codon:yes stop_codon:yes gene_type:complete